MRGGPRQAKRKQSLRSRRGFAELDGRLLEAREEKRLIRELTAHCGGHPSITQMVLIKRSARLLIMIGQLERRLIEGNSMGDLAARRVVALHGALRLSLTALPPANSLVLARRRTWTGCRGIHPIPVVRHPRAGRRRSRAAGRRRDLPARAR
jgi:hypothetical protein